MLRTREMRWRGPVESPERAAVVAAVKRKYPEIDVEK
jgi:hypothetical protein